MEVLTGILCALALFLFGMSLLGESLQAMFEKGGALHTLPKRGGFLLGAGVTALLQSSSATTVLAVSLCDSGLLSFSQASAAIAGANVGTTSTAWLLCLGWSVPDGEQVVLALLAVAGLGLYLASGHRTAGAALTGLFLLLSGMRSLVAAAAPIGDTALFLRLASLAEHPAAGFLAGAAFTGVLQSSSVSVGMLQALAAGGTLRRAAAVPLLLGINVGTCSTTLLSALSCGGAGRRAAAFHLRFNLVGAVLWTPLCLLRGLLAAPVTPVEIAVFHTLFNLTASAVVLPTAGTCHKFHPDGSQFPAGRKKGRAVQGVKSKAE
ncbi:Na/Pi symporter [Oscillibacter sp. MSJ-2]|uniref:Na/Pi symporter n=1 Tax=Dysosmobacter acutus TaxID=2841504 RepID=A0ABS6F9F7_9FIRM|nr:Na/Pi symporter [Dysosmobacter acutus]MBU5626926.1 Na/Pi symporter [Dysosmobacter acutus]